jgi:hypothetical protein
MTDSAPQNTGISNSIVPDLSALAGLLAERIDAEFAPLVDARENLREQLLKSGEIITVPLKPDHMPESMCAIDGARVTDKLYAADLLVAVASTANAHSTAVKHPNDSSVWADIQRHVDGTERLAQAAMGAQEVLLAARAPHALRIMDGSLVTPLIALSQGLFVKAPALRDAVADMLLNQWDIPEALGSLIAGAPGTLIAIAKSDSSTQYATRFGNDYGVRFPVADRFLATQILQPGEMFKPRPLTELLGQKIDEPEGSARVKSAAQKLRPHYEHLAALARGNRVQTTYFRPRGSHTVLRIEYILGEQDNPADTSIAAQYASIISTDMAPPHMLEPFCQHAVDKQAKQISSATEALKARMLKSLPADKADSYKALLAQSYRT